MLGRYREATVGSLIFGLILACILLLIAGYLGTRDAITALTWERVTGTIIGSPVEGLQPSRKGKRFDLTVQAKLADGRVIRGTTTVYRRGSWFAAAVVPASGDALSIYVDPRRTEVFVARETLISFWTVMFQFALFGFLITCGVSQIRRRSQTREANLVPPDTP